MLVRYPSPEAVGLHCEESVAFDVYVGTMTRFYRHDWENVAQCMAREQGMQYTMIYAGGQPEAPPPAKEVRQAVSGWCRALSGGLEPHGYGPVQWDEGDHQPYFTDRPAWDGYSALLVWAAHADHPDLPLPAEVPESWVDDPAYQRSIVREFKSRFRTILEPQLWLPTEFPFVFEAPTLVSEDKTCIGSAFTLKQQLDDLHAQTSDKLQQLKSIGPTGPPSPKREGLFGALRRGKKREPEPPNAGLAETAAFGLQLFRDLATKACEHRLPILLHF